MVSLAPDAERAWRPDGPLDVATTLAPLLRGQSDPSARLERDGAFWRATRTPEGAATLRITRRGDDVHFAAWGPGAGHAVAHGPELCGALDSPADFAPPPALRDLHRRNPGLRIPRTRAVYEALFRAVLEQRVTSMEASRAYRALVGRFGEPAPGPCALRLVPSPETLRHVPYFELHPLGVEMRRAETLRFIASRAARLEETATFELAEARARLQAIPGVGVWTIAEVSVVALGDADALSVGDFHLKNLVAFALTGRPRGTDDDMVALLEPFRPHRARVMRLLALSRIRPPAFGPKRALHDFRNRLVPKAFGRARH